MKLVTIPKENYTNYRYEVIFKAYKWDPQVEDHNTVAKQVLLMDKKTIEELESYAEELTKETIQMEEALLKNLPLAKKLGLPKKILTALESSKDYDSSKHIRLMRFDFHPTETGWMISEVNSDVPGGFAEAAVLPTIANQYFPDYQPRHNIAENLTQEFSKQIKKNGTIGFVHCTSYSDDRQVVQFLSDYFNEKGFNSLFLAPDHVKWEDKQAVSILEEKEVGIDGIVRFFPLEWLENLPKKSNWQGFYDCVTSSCNHPAAILTQSKRLPLVWDKLDVLIPTWKKLLPETKETKEVKASNPEWIYKPAFGRVGEDISIVEAITEKELKKIRKKVRWNSRDWVAQKKFKSKPLLTEDGEAYHLCIGVFTVNGKCAGFYGRISPFPRIDARAKDIPILVEREEQ